MKPLLAAPLFVFLLACASGAAAEGSDNVVADFRDAAHAQASAASAGRPPATTPDAASAVPVGDPFLWRVEGKSSPSFIFGTNHSVSVSALNPIVLDLLAQSKRLVLERTAVDDLWQTHPELFQLPADQSLDQLLGPKLWSILLKRVNPSIAPEDLKTFRPFIAYASVKPSDGVQASKTTMDDELMKHAADRGEPVEGLDTPEELYRFADRAVTLNVLRQSLEMGGDISGLVARSRKAYLDGDERAFKAIDDEGAPLEDPSVGRIMVGERNAKWLPVLEARLRSGGAFVAVGLEHVIGDGQLIDLLRRDGFVVGRVVVR